MTVAWIASAGGVAKAWLATLVMMGAQGTLLAVLALALARVGRLTPGWQAAIWLVVIAKFALPWGPALPWSLSDLIASLSQRGGEVVTQAVPPALQPAPPPPHLWPAVGWLALAALWAAGATIVIVRALVAHRHSTRLVRHARPAPDHAITLLGRLAASVRTRAPRLVIGGAEIGPHVIGTLRPTIVVPEALLADRHLLRAALLHELAHIRRRDGLARILQVGARALMFFWPVVRIVSRRLDLAREAACDAWALEVGDISRPAYARLLVQMTALRSGALSLAVPYSLDTRVKAVLGPPARARLGHLHKLALAGWIAIALGGARTAAARGEHVTCRYTPQLAEALFLAYPQADLDGDGTLSRDEACELQAELRRAHAADDASTAQHLVSEELASRLDPEASAQLATSLLAEPLCCNCDRPLAYSQPEAASCPNVEGVDR